MKVSLLQYTEPDNLMKRLPAMCYGKESNDKGFNIAVESGHYSLLEHFYFTVEIHGISRACSLQLLNHRHLSKVQKSQRLTKIDESSDWYIIPNTIYNNYDLVQKYCKHIKESAELYKEMLELGIPKEDARYVLPESTETSLIVSMNLRAFIEQAQRRLCYKAQWEIRELYRRIKNILLPNFSFIKELAVPLCMIYKCPERVPCSK